MKRLLYIAVCAALLACAGVWGYRFFSLHDGAVAGPPPVRQMAAYSPLRPDSMGTYQMPAPRVPPDGQKEYYNARYHFALLYPGTLKVAEYTENIFSLTVTFRDPASGYGFQIFVTPYGDQEVTQARLDLDEPSGVVESFTRTTVGGKPAVTFFGNNSVMGDTREVWFVNHGFLYEVTTYKALDSWMSDIMQSWEFL